MTEHNDITITRVPSDPPHYRASDGAYSGDGFRWVNRFHDELSGAKSKPYRTAFHAQILAPSTPEQPERDAETGDWIEGEFTDGPREVVNVLNGVVWYINEDGNEVYCSSDYTIVPPPTATGDKITERDGVWEESSTGYIRALVVSGSVVSVVGKDGRWHDPRDLSSSANFTLISTDPADLTKGWKGEGC